jgi:hypothetical protein
LRAAVGHDAGAWQLQVSRNTLACAFARTCTLQGRMRREIADGGTEEGQGAVRSPGGLGARCGCLMRSGGGVGVADTSIRGLSEALVGPGTNGHDSEKWGVVKSKDSVIGKHMLEWPKSVGYFLAPVNPGYHAMTRVNAAHVAVSPCSIRSRSSSRKFSNNTTKMGLRNILTGTGDEIAFSSLSILITYFISFRCGTIERVIADLVPRIHQGSGSRQYYS